MPFNIGPGELIIVLIIALLVVGPGKLPDVGAALGKSIREFRKAATDVKDATSLEAPAAPAASVSVAAAPAVAAPVAAAPVAAAAVPVAPAAPASEAAPVSSVPEPAGGLPAELTSADEQPTPSA